VIDDEDGIDVNPVASCRSTLPIPKPSIGFYDFEDYERSVDAAKATDPNASLIVLLGGEARLRCGEMMALEWRDVDLQNRQICVLQSIQQAQQRIPWPKATES
jgi:integrase